MRSRVPAVLLAMVCAMPVGTAPGPAPARLSIARRCTGLVVLPPGNGGVDELRFGAVPARYVRMSAVRAATEYGSSVWEMSVYGGSDANLAAGRPTTASSADPNFPAGLATDGDAQTRQTVTRIPDPATA